MKEGKKSGTETKVVDLTCYEKEPISTLYNINLLPTNHVASTSKQKLIFGGRARKSAL